MTKQEIIETLEINKTIHSHDFLVSGESVSAAELVDRLETETLMTLVNQKITNNPNAGLYEIILEIISYGDVGCDDFVLVSE